MHLSHCSTGCLEEGSNHVQGTRTHLGSSRGKVSHLGMECRNRRDSLAARQPVHFWAATRAIGERTGCAGLYPSAPDPAALNEFRHAVDNVRLTAWSVSELINANHIKKNPDTVLAFLSAERVRRFDQLVKNLCGDIERGLITEQTNGMHSLRDSVNALQQRLTQAAKSHSQFTR